MDIDAEEDTKQTPNKIHTKPPNEDEESPAAMSESKEKRKVHDAMMDEKMKKPFATFTENTQKQLTEQAEKHAIQIAEMKQTTIETQNLLTNKTMPTQSVIYHRASAHFTSMTKAYEVLFDGQPENCPAFENHLLNEAENPTIRWNNELINFQLMDKTTKPFNFLEGYSRIYDICTKGRSKTYETGRPSGTIGTGL
jgi:hypothetical protein